MTANLIRQSLVVMTCALLISCDIEPKVKVHNKGAEYRAQINNSSQMGVTASALVASHLGSLLGWEATEITSATRDDLITRTNGEHFQLFYYYGHTRIPGGNTFTGMFWTNNGDLVEPSDIAPKSPYGFVFINGCFSALNPGKDAFDAKFHSDPNSLYAAMGWDGMVDKAYSRKFAELFFEKCDSRRSIAAAANQAMIATVNHFSGFSAGYVVVENQGDTAIVTWGDDDRVYLDATP